MTADHDVRSRRSDDRPLWPAALGYLALRLLLTVVLTVAVLAIGLAVGLEIPWLVAAMLAVIMQLPLGWLLFAKQRERVTAAMAASTSRRRRARQELQDALAGVDGPDPDVAIGASAEPAGPDGSPAGSDVTADDSGDAVRDADAERGSRR